MCEKSIAFSFFFGWYRMLLSRLVPLFTCEEVPGCASLIWMLCSLSATCIFTYVFNHVVLVCWFAALKRVWFQSGVSSVNTKRKRGGDEEAAIYQALAFTDDRLLYLIKLVLVGGQRKSSSCVSFHVAFAFLMALVLPRCGLLLLLMASFCLSELKRSAVAVCSLFFIRVIFFLPWHSWSGLPFSWPLPPLKWVLSYII